MNGYNYPTGCAGAVWQNGEFTATYCSGLNVEGENEYPWWTNCCEWTGDACVASE